MPTSRMLGCQKVLNDLIWQALQPDTHLVQFDDVGVVQHLHDLNLPVDLLQVHSVQLGLVDDLNGHLRGDGAPTVQL